jgi:hypothetical protein
MRYELLNSRDDFSRPQVPPSTQHSFLNDNLAACEQLQASGFPSTCSDGKTLFANALVNDSLQLQPLGKLPNNQGDTPLALNVRGKF